MVIRFPVQTLPLRDSPEGACVQMRARLRDTGDGARVLVNTSDFEGFPNTFLQAWARRIPTVSFCDTGSTIDGQSVVTVVNGLDAMTGAVGALMLNDARWIETGSLAQRYVARGVLAGRQLVAQLAEQPVAVGHDVVLVDRLEVLLAG